MESLVCCAVLVGSCLLDIHHYDDANIECVFLWFFSVTFYF